jgi:TBC1 domain family member 15
MSDDEEGEYNTIHHTKSGKGVKLLFSKSKVRPNLVNILC